MGTMVQGGGGTGGSLVQTHTQRAWQGECFASHGGSGRPHYAKNDW